MSHHRVSRVVALILLAWIAFDLAALDTCALDVGSQPVASDQAVPDTPREHLLLSSTALYHPPQRPA